MAVRESVRAEGDLIIVPGLARSELRQLAEQTIRAEPVGRLLNLVDTVNGNPLHLLEILWWLARVEWIDVRAGLADLRPDVDLSRLPDSLASVLTDRLDFLSPQARQFVSNAALLGTRFSVVDVATVGGQTVTDMQGAVAEAIQAAVIEEAETRLAFRHPLLRRALYDSAPPGQLRAQHLAAARALASAKASVELVAEQLLIAANGLDGPIVDWLIQAAPRLTHSAPRMAAGLLERALRSLGDADPRRETMSVHLVEATFQAGDYAAVARIAAPFRAPASSSAERAREAWHLAYALLHLGRPGDAMQVTLTAVALKPMQPWSARLTALLAMTQMVLGQYEASEANAVKAVDSGRALGDALAQGYALHALSVVAAAHHTDLVHHRALQVEALALLADTPEALDLRLLVLNNRAQSLAREEDWAAAEAAIAVQIPLAERVGASLRLASARLVSAQLSLSRGRWDDALAEVDSLGPLAHEPSELKRRGIGAVIAARRGDPVAVDRYRDGAPAWSVQRRDLHRQSYHMIWACSLTHQARGDYATALSEILDWAEPAYGFRSIRLLELPDVLRCALAAGDRTAADVVVAAAKDIFERDPISAHRAAADWCRGLMEADADAVTAAAEHYRRNDRPPALAGAMEDLAVIQAGRGDRQAARRSLAEALTVYEGLGAAGDIARAKSRLTDLGVRPQRVAPRQRVATGWDALTFTEVRIARLIADGWSNPHIATELHLSRRTVEFYVSRMLRKLDVHSRVDIAHASIAHV